MKTIHARLARLKRDMRMHSVTLCDACRADGGWRALLPSSEHTGPCVCDADNGPDWKALLRTPEPAHIAATGHVS